MKTNINRRSFLKGAAMTGAAALAAGMAGCAPKTQSESLAETGGSEFGTFDADGVYTPSFLIAPDPVDESTLVETVEADVVVVGMGLAGICAADGEGDPKLSERFNKIRRSLCTLENPLWFSHRRASLAKKQHEGRMLALIVRE